MRYLIKTQPKLHYRNGKMNTVNTQNISSSLQQAMNGPAVAKGSSQEVQDRFMTLLVTQMKNQDPLNPMDNAQMTSQLAQLSTVTGIDKLNSTMESLISSVQSSQSYQAASMIGRGVLVNTSTFRLSESMSAFSVSLPSNVDALNINIVDSAGQTVKSLNLGAQKVGSVPLSWNGLDNVGSQLADGVYKIKAEATLAGKAVDIGTQAYASVLSVSKDSSGIMLNLDNGISVYTNEVAEII